MNALSTLFLRNRHLLVLTIVVSIAAGLFAVGSMQRYDTSNMMPFERLPL